MRCNLLKAEIAAREMTYREVAEKAGISKSTFSAKINGKRPFDVDEVLRIVDVLGITDNQRKVEIFLT